MSPFRIDVNWPGAGTSMVIDCIDQESADAVARHKAARQAKLVRGEYRKLVTWKATPVAANAEAFDATSYDPARDADFGPWRLPSTHPVIVQAEAEARAVVREAQPERHVWGAL